MREGACIQCAQPGWCGELGRSVGQALTLGASSFVPFHVSCAIRHGVIMRMQEKKGVLLKEVFCLRSAAAGPLPGRRLMAARPSHTRSRQDEPTPITNAVAEEMPLKFDPSRVAPSLSADGAS